MAGLLVLPLPVLAGGSPETTLLVVNARSPLSVQIANEYLQLRAVPGTHVVWLDDVPSMDRISIDEFRKRIWSPIRDFIRSHELEEEIDIIAYSGDFPYAVDFSSDLRTKKIDRNKYLGNIASLTSLTYFARRVEAGDPGYLGANYYFRNFAGPAKKAAASRPVSSTRLAVKEVVRLRGKARNFLHHKDAAAAVKIYRRILDSYPDEPLNWYNLARSLAAVGEREKALENLTLAVDHGWSNSIRAGSDKYFRSFHSDPVFRELLERMETAWGPFQLTHGFRHRYVWSNADLAFWETGDVLNQYYLSTLLAYTGARGNSLPEIRNYLGAAAASDGTRPRGTVYLLENRDVRSETRQPLFPPTLAQLARRGHRGEVLYRGRDGQDGMLPRGRDDVIGAVVGTRRFDWNKSGSRLLPGAIAESLTSYGGDFDRKSQTKLTEFLRHGAAGSSGAVAEPFSFQEKFPVPLMHAWYADGCSLAEAFYQSVKAPYQLVVVGDPLARPFAVLADIDLKSPSVQKPWSGTVMLDAAVDVPEDRPIARLEFWVDGQHLFDTPPGEPFSWDTRTVEDGSHDIRLVAVEDSGIETRSPARFRVRVANTGHRVEVDPVTGPIAYDAEVDIGGTAPGADSVEIIRGYRILGRTAVRNSRWRLTVAAAELGMGRVSLRARALFGDGTAVRSDVVEFEVVPPASLAPARAEAPAGEGLAAVAYDSAGRGQHLQIGQLDGPLRELRKKRIKASRLKLGGYFHVARAGFYQLAVRSGGHLRLSVNDRVMLDEKWPAEGGEGFVPLSLEPGWYRLDIDAAFSGRPFLKLVLGGEQAPVTLGADGLRHRPSTSDG